MPTYRTYKSQRPGERFKAGRGYYGGRPAARPPRPVDPLAPLDEQAMSRQIRGGVQSQISPLVAEITRSINARAQAGSRNLQGVTEEQARRLEGFQGRMADVYGRGRSALEGIDKAQADRLAQVGGQDVADLQARLGQAGLDAGPLAATLASEARGASAAGYARGAAEHGQLALQQTGAEEYAAKLPGLARLTGAQGVRELQAQAQRSLADQAGEIRARVPGLVGELTEKYRDREFNKGIARIGFEGDIASENTERARIRAEERQRAAERQADLNKEQREASRERAKENREARREFAKEMREAARERNKETRADKEFRARERLKAKLRPRDGDSGGGGKKITP